MAGKVNLVEYYGILLCSVTNITWTRTSSGAIANIEYGTTYTP